MIKSVSYIIFAFTLCLAFTGIAHANPCRTADGYLDKGIGGTGLIRGGDDDDGIGGTGLRDNGGDDDDGIGGTGAKIAEGELIYVSGVIHAFGSVCVNGVQIEYSERTPVTNDSTIKINAKGLKLGQVVDVVAEKKPGRAKPQAQKINVRFPLQGPVSSVSPNGRNIKVLGRDVRMNNASAAKGLKPGTTVRISGLPNTRGQIVASYVEKLPLNAGAKVNDAGRRAIPKNIKHISVQGFVSAVTSEGRVSVNGQSFDLGAQGKAVTPGSRLIISGERASDGIVRTKSWVRENSSLDTRSGADSDRAPEQSRRGRGRGGDSDRNDRDDDFDRDDRDDDRDDRIDNSGPGSRNSGRDRDDFDNDDRFEHDNSGSGNRNDRPDLDTDIDRDDVEIERIDNSGRGNQNDRPERIERPDDDFDDRPDTIERIDNSGPERVERPEKVDVPDKVEKPDKIEKPDNSGKGRPDRPERPDNSGKGRPDRPERDD